MSIKEEIIQAQKRWAASSGLEPDERGYLSSYVLNLYQSLKPESQVAFERGSGSELRDKPRRPAKMRAVHSSSALAVNVFDVWVGRDTTPLLAALNLEPGPADVRFEEQFPTGLPGEPPNIDVVLERPDGVFIAIESKFTEWVTPKPLNKPQLKDKYFPDGVGVWERVGLPKTQRLAADLYAGEVVFRHLDAAQLIKHALGLAIHRGDKFQLMYVFFDVDGAEAKEHWSEISSFANQIGTELRFQAISYQRLFSGLAHCPGISPDYLDYLRMRYFPTPG